MPEDLAAEHRDAATLAETGRAGPHGAACRRRPTLRDIGAAGDRMAHQLLVDELNRLYPDDDVRSEEGLEHVAGVGRLWIVDPLDGTREFRERGAATGPSTSRWPSAAWPSSAPSPCPRSTSCCPPADPPVLPRSPAEASARGWSCRAAGLPTSPTTSPRRSAAS